MASVNKRLTESLASDLTSILPERPQGGPYPASGEDLAGD